MTDKKDTTNPIDQAIMHTLMDVLVRVSVLENLLIEKQILTDKEIQDAVVEMAKSITQLTAQKLADQFSSVDTDEIDDILTELNATKKNNDVN